MVKKIIIFLGVTPIPMLMDAGVGMNRASGAMKNTPKQSNQTWIHIIMIHGMMLKIKHIVEGKNTVVC